MEAPRRVLFVFLDGVGLGSSDPSVNPLAAARLPAIRRLLDGAPPVLGSFALGTILTGGAASRPIDATFDVPGLPQSGTGQTALLTGRDTPGILGRHFGPWVPTALRELLATRSIFSILLEAGLNVGLANAFPRSHPVRSEAASRRPGAIPFAAATAGILTRDEDALRAGDAIVSSITTDGWRRYVDPDAPVVQPETAGEQLARISREHDGHRGTFGDAVEVLERIDAFLAGVRAQLQPDTLLVITSDHGNVEDVRAGHTRNPVPLIAVGPGSAMLIDRVERLDHLAPVIVSMLASGQPVGPW